MDGREHKDWWALGGHPSPSCKSPGAKRSWRIDEAAGRSQERAAPGKAHCSRGTNPKGKRNPRPPSGVGTGSPHRRRGELPRRVKAGTTNENAPALTRVSGPREGSPPTDSNQTCPRGSSNKLRRCGKEERKGRRGRGVQTRRRRPRGRAPCPRPRRRGEKRPRPNTQTGALDRERKGKRGKRGGPAKEKAMRWGGELRAPPWR